MTRRAEAGELFHHPDAGGPAANNGNRRARETFERLRASNRGHSICGLFTRRHALQEPNEIAHRIMRQSLN